MQIEVLPSSEEAAAAAASSIADRVAQVSSRPFTFGLAGGTTPRAAYRDLREFEVPWERVVCWLSDERWVPAEDDRSNAKMVRAELVDHIGSRLFTPDTSLPDPRLSAAAYEGVVLPLLVHGGTLAPDLVLLGIGDDGHTASLFPETEALEATIPAYVANWVPVLDAWRLTATVGLLSAASAMIFLVTGADKAPMIRRILGDEEPLPARLVARATSEAGGAVTWILDEAAAARL